MENNNKLIVECLNCGNKKDVINKPILMPEETHIIFSNYCPKCKYECNYKYWIEFYVSKDGNILNHKITNSNYKDKNKDGN